MYYMSKSARILFWLLFVFSVVHTIRDVMQIYGVHSILSDSFVTHDIWCSPYCDYVAFPVELLSIIVSIFVLRRNNVGLIGKGILLLQLFWPIALLAH